LPEWNERFATLPANATDAHRPIGRQQDLASALANVESRKVANDYTIAWNGRKWQVPKAAISAGLRSSSIRIEEHLDGRMVGRLKGQPVQLELCDQNQPQAKTETEPASKRFAPPPAKSQWMDGFRVTGNAAWKAYREQEAATVSAPLRSPSGLPPRG
jgi:hypothetical protein